MLGRMDPTTAEKNPECVANYPRAVVDTKVKTAKQFFHVTHVYPMLLYESNK